MNSYTSQTRGLASFIRETFNLVQAYSGAEKREVEWILERVHKIESLVQQEYGVKLHGLRILDIGPGQRLMEMKYFGSRGNEISGVDRDVIVQGLDPLGYVRMLRTNGLKRTIKTMGRKLLRIDARFTAELARNLGVSRFRRLKVYRRDAGSLGFENASFDFVYSVTVFQHLEAPERAIAEIERVLKPGGVAYVDFMPYTGPPGALDIRQLGGRDTHLPPWAHLRPQYQALVHESAYLNKLRLKTWEDLFESRMPGCKFIYASPEANALTPTLRELQARGELVDYSPKELLSSNVSVMWRKPETA